MITVHKESDFDMPVSLGVDGASNEVLIKAQGKVVNLGQLYDLTRMAALVAHQAKLSILDAKNKHEYPERK